MRKRFPGKKTKKEVDGLRKRDVDVLPKRRYTYGNYWWGVDGSNTEVKLTGRL